MLSLYMISIRFSNYVLFSANIIHNLQNPGRVRIHVLKGGRCRIYVFFSDQPRPQPDISTLGGPDILLILPI